MEPAFLFIAPEESYRFLSLKVNPGAGLDTHWAAEEMWSQVLPGQPYTGFFQDTIFDATFRENTNIKHLFGFIAGLALFIACLGLWGMALQSVTHRMKEISLRRVMGGSTYRISRTVNRGFLSLLCIAAVISTPFGYVAMQSLLSSVYPDPVKLGPMPFVWSFLFVLLLAVATISTQVLRISTSNPAEVLRND